MNWRGILASERRITNPTKAVDENEVGVRIRAPFPEIRPKSDLKERTGSRDCGSFAEESKEDPEGQNKTSQLSEIGISCP